ncbi:MAG: cytochrome C [Acidobacteria bacterium]|nr:MAG: cytochrome C [Acidobacteriota bacterium]
MPTKLLPRIRGAGFIPALVRSSITAVLALLLLGNVRWLSAQAGSSSKDSDSVASRQEAKQEKHAAKRTSEMPGAVPGATYVGSDTCKSCHDEIYSKHFEGTPHFALLKENAHGCEDCHGPGSAHVEGGGDPAKIIRFSQLSPAQASQRCLQCHESSLENVNFSRSVHLKNGVGCLACHSPHHATESDYLLTNKQILLCYGCHATQKAEFARPYRHRVDVGLIQCSDCHNPHGTLVGRQLRTAAGEFPVCTNCHTETMGPFAFEHVPVKQEGCTSCHTPHGSTNPRLLRVSQVNLLCLQCHTLTPGSNVPEAPSFHNQNAKYQACTMCHTQIHGSNFDEFFFR